MKRTDPWSKLTSGVIKRVNSVGKYDFFWVTIEDNMPALQFRLADRQGETTPLPKFKDLEVRYRDLVGGRALVISLNDRSQIDLFEILCRDVVEAGEQATNKETALRRAIQRTRRWHHLLRGGALSGLSVEEQRGLVGELFVLRELINVIGPEAAVEAWTGPSGTAKDFELRSVCIEVKSKRSAAKPSVRISSEDQLADVAGARLFLRIADVASAIKPQGQTLHDHVKETENLFEPASSAFDTWEGAIASVGYETTQDYEELRWKIVDAKSYEVVDGFPRIETPLTQGVQAVKYSIALDACAPFEVRGDLMSIVKNENSK